MGDIADDRKNTKYIVPIWEKLNLTVEEAVAYSNIGENTLRELIENQNYSFVLFVGKKKLIKRKQFEEWLQKQQIIK